MLKIDNPDKWTRQLVLREAVCRCTAILFCLLTWGGLAMVFYPAFMTASNNETFSRAIWYSLTFFASVIGVAGLAVPVALLLRRIWPVGSTQAN